MGVLRIVVADDHKLMIDALRLVLVPDEGMELVGATTDGRKLLPLVANTRPDVVLLDVRMPDMDGLKCLAQLRDRYPEIKVVMLSGNDDPALIQEALRGGARAFVLKQIDPAELPAAIRQAHEGPILGVVGREATDESGLTAKEREVLALLTRGLTNREIAKELWLTEQTVKFHLTNIYRKFGVANRTEAAHHAFRHALVGPYQT